MAARAHVCVAVFVSTFGLVASGCIFGGGGDKKRAERVPAPVSVAVPAPDVAPHASAAQPSKPADDAVAKALAPKESVVQWHDPDALSLGESQPRVDEPSPDAAPAEPRRSPRIDPGEAVRHARRDPAQELAQETAPAPSPDAVANEPLEVKGAAPADATPQPEAAQASLDEPGDLSAKVVSVANASAGSDPLAARIAQRLRENPGDVPAHFDHQLFRFLAEEQTPDLGALSTLPSEDRELLTALIDGLSNFRSALRGDTNMLHSRKVRPLLDMAARLKSQAELWIPTIALCSRVKGYGVYEPMNARFVAGAAHEVLVYCEVANFASQQNEQGIWEVKLSQEAVLYKDNGHRVMSNRRESTVDRARNRRQDFCVAQRLVLPANLPIDRYILKVTVTDEQVKRLAEATIPIELVAQLDPQQPQQPIEKLGPVARPSDQPDPRTAGFSSSRTDSVDSK